MINSSKIYALAVNPWAVIGSLAIGGAFGLLLPALSQKFSIVGDIYVNLLKMTTLPFMVSAVIFSLQRLFRDGGTSRLLLRVVTVILGASATVAVVGAVVLLTMRPGANISTATMHTFGAMVGSDDTGSNETVMSLYGTDTVPKAIGLTDMLK